MAPHDQYPGRYLVHYTLFFNCDFCKYCLEELLTSISELWSSPLKFVTQERASLSSPGSPWAPYLSIAFL